MLLAALTKLDLLRKCEANQRVLFRLEHIHRFFQSLLWSMENQFEIGGKKEICLPFDRLSKQNFYFYSCFGNFK